MQGFYLALIALITSQVSATTIPFEGRMHYTSYSKKSAKLAVFSSKGSSSIDHEGFLQIIDVQEAKTIAQFSIGWVSWNNTRIALSPDGKQVVVAINGIPQAKIWSVEKGEVVSEIRLGDFFIDVDPVISPDGQTLALATHFGPLLVVDMQTGILLFKIPTSKTATLKVAFSPSGKSLAVIDQYDETLRVYNARTGDLLHKVESIDFGSYQTFGHYLDKEEEFVVAVKDGLKRVSLGTGETTKTFASGSYFLEDFVGDFMHKIWILSSLEGQDSVTEWDGVSGEEGPKSTFDKKMGCSDLLPYDDHISLLCFPRGVDGSLEIQSVK